MRITQTKGDKMDNQRVRDSVECPGCRGRKDKGLVLCWQSYRSMNARNGGGERAIAAAERRLEVIERDVIGDKACPTCGSFRHVLCGSIVEPMPARWLVGCGGPMGHDGPDGACSCGGAR